MSTNLTKNWDEEMQVRVYGAAPQDDYNHKTQVYPKYSSDPARARQLVEKINESGRYRVNISGPSEQSPREFAVEVSSADGRDRLSYVKNASEALSICEAIVTADVKL